MSNWILLDRNFTQKVAYVHDDRYYDVISLQQVFSAELLGDGAPKPSHHAFRAEAWVTDVMYSISGVNAPL
ncbi:MAG: hypothetical protein MI923_01765 [Phycisphaerales bacterium]|nr:hypothetical protein [Phycisphaerales bacterium]